MAVHRKPVRGWLHVRGVLCSSGNGEEFSSSSTQMNYLFKPVLWLWCTTSCVIWRIGKSRPHFRLHNDIWCLIVEGPCFEDLLYYLPAADKIAYPYGHWWLSNIPQLINGCKRTLEVVYPRWSVNRETLKGPVYLLVQNCCKNGERGQWEYHHQNCLSTKGQPCHGKHA